MEKLFETMTRHLRNKETMDYLIKWRNPPIEYSKWEDPFTQGHQQLIKHWGQCVYQGQGHVKP